MRLLLQLECTSELPLACTASSPFSLSPLSGFFFFSMHLKTKCKTHIVATIYLIYSSIKFIRAMYLVFGRSHSISIMLRRQKPKILTIFYPIYSFQFIQSQASRATSALASTSVCTWSVERILYAVNEENKIVVWWCVWVNVLVVCRDVIMPKQWNFVQFDLILWVHTVHHTLSLSLSHPISLRNTHTTLITTMLFIRVHLNQQCESMQQSQQQQLSSLTSNAKS